MTRATLLHVLERPTALGPAEVRELEQLAQAFPYCQTAHLLLAKAAHDQGTMLAGQRLRRAATYAADRTLLRRLIEEVEPQPEAAPILAPPHPLDLVDWPDEYVAPASTQRPQPIEPITETPAPVAVSPALPVAIAPPPAAAEVPLTVVQPPAQADMIPATAPPVAPPAPLETAPVAAVAPSVMDQPASPALEAAAVLPTELLPPTEAVTEPASAAPAEPSASVSAPAETPGTAAAALLATAQSVETPTATVPETATVSAAPVVAEELPALESEPHPMEATPDAVAPTASESTGLAAEAIAEEAPLAIEAHTAAVDLTSVEATPSVLLPAEAPVEIEAELPAQAPAIRPPAEVGEARFEFGLAEVAPAPAAPTYELPGLVDEWAASAVTRSLGTPDALAPTSPPPAVPVFTPAAFTGDAVVGYAFGESSRLGLSMQLLDLLTAKAEAAETATAVVAAAQPPASALPPAGTFFEPDPLLLDHWATHRPAVPELPSTVDLINNFLKRQPRLTRPAMLPPAPGGQTDLSVRSTRAEPDLVSENLARIFVRQGKTARAIEIYEKLMVKQPEKMAYFAAQIQSLQPSA